MLVLASKSPRRQEILKSAGIPFTVRSSGVKERRRDGEDCGAHVTRLAREKARAVEIRADEVVLGADTVVVINEQILEKPASAGDAARMLRLLSDREHVVITGICLLGSGREIVDTARTMVRFLPLREPEIAAYVASGEPVDKAGAYAIQGLASKFIDRIEGCYFNVVGLPIALVYRHLKDLERP